VDTKACQLCSDPSKICTSCRAAVVARSKVIIYVVLFISTDDMTYHDIIYCDTFRSIIDAQKYVKEQVKETGWSSASKDEYEIKELLL